MGRDGIVSKNVNDLLDIYGREQFINVMFARIRMYNSFPSITPDEFLLLGQRNEEIDR